MSHRDDLMLGEVGGLLDHRIFRQIARRGGDDAPNFTDKGGLNRDQGRKDAGRTGAAI